MLCSASIYTTYRRDSSRPSAKAFVYTHEGEYTLIYHTDILNVLNLSFHRSTRARFQARDHHKRMEDARHLSKYVFPREYGLATVFASAAKAHKYSDVADREDEIKVGTNVSCTICRTQL